MVRGILLVEDNPGDVGLIRKAAARASLAVELHVVGDGDEALEFLRRTGAHATAPRPDLVLLDLNLPTVDGREVLDEVKSDPDLRTIPVVVMTSSDAEEDVQAAYARHANSFLTKPGNLAELQAVLAHVYTYWFGTVRLPEARDASP